MSVEIPSSLVDNRVWSLIFFGHTTTRGLGTFGMGAFEYRLD